MKKKFREEIIAAARRSSQDIGQIFVDCDYWNAHVRKPGEDLIDPDPDGLLRRMKDGIDRLLDEEDQRPIPPFLSEEDRAGLEASAARTIDRIVDITNLVKRERERRS